MATQNQPHRLPNASSSKPRWRQTSDEPCCLIFVGFHHKRSVSVIRKQIPEEAMSGGRKANCAAKQASTVAERIQSCAILIITSRMRRACSTAARPASLLERGRKLPRLLTPTFAKRDAMKPLSPTHQSAINCIYHRARWKDPKRRDARNAHLHRPHALRPRCHRL